MIRNNSIYKYTLTNGGGTLNLPVTDPYTVYRITGVVSLSGSWTIQASGTPVEGDEFRILYEARATLGVNTITIFGLSIPQELAAEDLEIYAYYNGSGWDTKILVDFESLPFITGSMIENDTIEEANIVDDAVTENKILDASITKDKIAADAVTTSKLEDEAVTVAKLYNTIREEVLIVPVSFESNEQGDNTISIPFACTVNSIRYTITKAIAATDAASITLYINGVLMTPNSISIPASTVINSTAVTSVTANNTVTAGQQLKFTTAKTTAGGKALLTVNLTRT
jgi:hypothetical protein